MQLSSFRYRLAAFLLAWSCFPVVLSAQEGSSKPAYTLVNHFQKGQTLYLSIDTTVKGSTNMGTQQVPINILMDMEFAFSTQDVDAAGNATVGVAINQMDMQDEMMGPQKLDIVEMIGAKDKTIVVKVNPQGQTLETQDNIGISNVNLQAMDQANPVRLSWPKMPDKPVSIGSSWSEETPVPLLGLSKPIISYSTYTLTGVEEKNGEQIATIAKQTRIDAKDVTMDPKSAGANTGMVTVKVTFQEYSAVGNGTLDFNLTQGRLVALRDTVDMIIDMGGETNVNQAAFPNEFRMKYTTNLVGTFSTTPPASSQAEGEVQAAAEVKSATKK